MNFVICENNIKCIEKYSKIIEELMFKRNEKYVITIFKDYNNDFFEFVKNNHDEKVYILDYSMKSNNGIEAAKVIRRFDNTSVIIYITSHTNIVKYIVFEETLYLTMISKNTNYNEKLLKNLNKALELHGKTEKITLRTDTGIVSIPINKILYLERDKLERKILICTMMGNYKIKTSLKDISDKLPNNFTKVGRSLIFNKYNIYCIENDKVVFIDNQKYYIKLNKTIKEEIFECTI